MGRTLSAESDSDVIVAPATGQGSGAIAIVRFSGLGCHRIVERMFRPLEKEAALSPTRPGLMVLGEIISPVSGVLDKGFAVLWKAPKSYTGEDTAEFHLHGARAVVRSVVECAVREGARIARPGEFTRRAFLNGRIDLAQAEAVCDLVQSETSAAARVALSQLQGGLSEKLHVIRTGLVPVLAELEATVDFPEDGIAGRTRQHLGIRIDAALAAIHALIDSFGRGRTLREGFRIVLAGPPNAGKSSLFNLLVGRERAIVSPHPGTTRDTIEALVEIGGVAVTLVDTAGLRALPEEIEAIGIARTREEIRAAGLVLYVVDSTQAEDAVAEYQKLDGVPHVVIANKIDRPGANQEAVAVTFHLKGRDACIPLSIQTTEGFAALEHHLRERLGSLIGDTNAPLATRERHVSALRDAGASLETVAQGLASSLSPEFLALDMAHAITRLDSITGRAGLDEEVLDAIFSQFCLGK